MLLLYRKCGAQVVRLQEMQGFQIKSSLAQQTNLQAAQDQQATSALLQ